jgi:transposase
VIALEEHHPSIPHSHLILSCPHADLCGPNGRAWLFHQVSPEDDRVERHLREFDLRSARR